MKAIPSMALVAAALVVSCASDSQPTCRNVEVDGERFCVYQDTITETGYECPTEEPNMFRDESRGLVVCSGRNERPPFDEIQDTLDEPPPMPSGGEPGSSSEREPEDPMVIAINTTECVDEDGDGWGRPASDTSKCWACRSGGFCAADCNDGDSTVHEDAIEHCNGIDDDCDGSVDEPMECDTDIDCPQVPPYVPSCDGAVCRYRPPVRIDAECAEAVDCVNGSYDERPEHCF